VNAKVLHYNPTLEELESSPGKYYFKKDVDDVISNDDGKSISNNLKDRVDEKGRFNEAYEKSNIKNNCDLSFS
jgi:hypothetical protein